MTNEEVELVKQVIATAGQVGAQGFGYLVRYQIWSGVADIFGCAAVVVLALLAFKRLLAWKPAEMEGHLPRGAAIAVLCVVIALFVCFGFDGFAKILAPEGAAIHAIIHH